MSIPTRIIDSHQHVFWQGRDDRGLVDDLDEHRIEKAWLLSWEIEPAEDARNYHGLLNPNHIRADGTHSGIPLTDLIKARDDFPGRFILGYCPHPLRGDAPALLEAAASMYKVQVCGEWKFRLLLDDPRCINLFRKAGELKLPIVLHLDVPYLTIDGKEEYQREWYGGTVANLERVLKACPNAIFIGHAPGFWREMGGDAGLESSVYPGGPVAPGGRLEALFAQYPNLYADLSAGSGLYALQRDPEHAALFLEKHADRLLFARDHYEQDLHTFLQTLDLSRETTEKIYWQNAEKLLRSA